MKQLIIMACFILVLYVLVRFFPIGLLFFPFVPLSVWAARKCRSETGSYRPFAEGMAYTAITMLAVCLIAWACHRMEVLQ